jgi:hypothetical protein
MMEIPFYQVGILVPDIEAARGELTRALGVSWEPVREVALGAHSIKVAFTIEGPPHLELIEGSPGSAWDATDGPRIDHIGSWTDDIERDKHLLVERGLPVDLDGASLGSPYFVYHSAKTSGLRFELISSKLRPGFLKRLETA